MKKRIALKKSPLQLKYVINRRRSFLYTLDVTYLYCLFVNYFISQ